MEHMLTKTTAGQHAVCGKMLFNQCYYHMTLLRVCVCVCVSVPVLPVFLPWSWGYWCVCCWVRTSPHCWADYWTSSWAAKAGHCVCGTYNWLLIVLSPSNPNPTNKNISSPNTHTHTDTRTQLHDWKCGSILNLFSLTPTLNPSPNLIPGRSHGVNIWGTNYF